MNENLDRIRHGWFPRKDAQWIVLAAIVKMAIRKLHNQKVYKE